MIVDQGLAVGSHTTEVHQMRVSEIKSIAEFDQLKANWDHVYSADPHAHLFLSWLWLRGWFEIAPYQWSVLALRPDDASEYVAFMPLITRGPKLLGFRPIQLIAMGGQPLASYTGFACLPEYEEEALAALADHIQRQPSWDRFEMEEVMDPRLDLFLDCFPGEDYDIQRSHGMPTLYIPLPDDWNPSLQTFMGSKGRRNMRRSLRQVEEHNGYQMTFTQEDSLERDIEILLTFWQWRWGFKPIAQWRRDTMRFFFENRRLWLATLWDSERPVAALAALTDEVKKTFYPYIVGHDPAYAKLSPGKLMLGYSIQDAIKNQFQVYDFLTGVDEYKFSFGPKRRNTTNIIISRKRPKSVAANGVTDIVERTRNEMIKILGNVKRAGIVKRLWFWYQANIKSYYSG
mgnify:CR=1 FL=1